MNRPTRILRSLRLRHMSATSALTDPVLDEKTTPKCVREALVFLRDTPAREIRADSSRAIRNEFARRNKRAKEPLVTASIVRKFRRYDPPTSKPLRIGDEVCSAYAVTQLLINVAEQWDTPTNLQGVLLTPYRAIPGVHFPWYGNPKYLTVLGDGCALLTVRVLATDEGGPSRFKLVRRDDAELQADIQAMDLDPRIKGERANTRENPGYHKPRFDDLVLKDRLDGDLDLSQFMAVVGRLYQSTYWG